MAERGLSDLLGHPTSRIAGIHNVVVFGRSVTFVLQTLRGVDEKRFDAWYAPFKLEMTKDPLLKYFSDLRTEILKEGLPKVSSSLYVESLEGSEIARLARGGPPGSTSFFMGDSIGGSGWIVPMPDGSEQKFYRDLPNDIRVTTALHLPDPPPHEHMGTALMDTSAENLCRLYVQYMAKVLVDAERAFGQA